LLDSLQGYLATSNLKQNLPYSLASTIQRHRNTDTQAYGLTWHPHKTPYLTSKESLKIGLYFLEFTAGEVGKKILFLSKKRYLLYKKIPVSVSSNRNLTEMCVKGGRILKNV
jgi:hypothetical protein